MFTRLAWRIAAAFLIVGAVASTWAAASAQDRVKLRIAFPTTPSTLILPHFVAHDQGWLRDKGIDIEEIWLVGDSNALRAMLSGRADIAAPGTFSALAAIAQGGKIKAFSSWQPLADYVIVARQEMTSLSQLSQARIAAASSGGLTTELPRMLLQKHNIDASKAVFFSVGGHEARLQAVIGGKADAALVGQLYATHGASLAKINVVADLAKEFPNLGYIYLVAQDKDLADPDKRKALEIYTQVAVIEASRFIMKNPDRASEIMHKRTPDVDLGLIKEVVGRLNRANVWGINGGIDLEMAKFTAELATTMQTVPRLMQPAEFLDSSIVEKLLKQTGTM